MKTITICGSMTFAKDMVQYQKLLEDLKFNVFIPGNGSRDLARYKEAGNTKEATRRKIENNYIKEHFKLISDSDAILVLNISKNNVSNYIGGNSFLEIGYAFSLNRQIFLLNDIPECSYKAEIEAMQPIVIGADLAKIQRYFEKLPKVYISSDNSIKVQSVSFSLNESGYNYDVSGFKTLSKVSEQPMTINETYDGAVNRLADLKKKIKGKKYEYLVSIESGLAKLHKNHNYFNVTVCIVEDNKGNSKTSIVSDIEFPKEMTDLVPSKYPDLGILVQKEYGSKYKDPFQYYTDGKVKRIDLLKYAIKNTLSQFNADKHD